MGPFEVDGGRKDLTGEEDEGSGKGVFEIIEIL